MWQPGSVRQEVNELVVESEGKKQVYRLFDHVTVTIQQRGSDSHPRTLAYYFLSNRRHKGEGGGGGGSLERGEVNFLTEIRKDLEENVGKAEEGRQEEASETTEDAEKAKMYRFFQKMKTVGISTAK